MGRQDQEFKILLFARSQVQLHISITHKDGQSIYLKFLLQADCLSRAEPVVSSLSLLLSPLRNSEIKCCAPSLLPTCASELLSSSQDDERFQHTEFALAGSEPKKGQGSRILSLFPKNFLF